MGSDYNVVGRSVQYQDLIALLDWLGLDRRVSAESGHVYTHAESRIVLHLPAHDPSDAVPQRTIGLAWIDLDQFGLMERLDFDIWLWQNDRNRAILRSVGPMRPGAAVKPESDGTANGRSASRRRAAGRRRPAAVAG